MSTSPGNALRAQGACSVALGSINWTGRVTDRTPAPGVHMGLMGNVGHVASTENYKQTEMSPTQGQWVLCRPAGWIRSPHEVRLPLIGNVKPRESYVTFLRPPHAHSGRPDRKYCEFKEDDRGSGFDRGHLAAAANHKWSQKAMDDTFYLSNVAPQNPHLNQNAWNNLEKLCRSLTNRYLNVFVCTGPAYLPRRWEMYVRTRFWVVTHVAVPTHFFKVLILEQMDGRGVELRSYVFPNEPVDEKIPLERFLVPIETIERASGLLFVPNIMRRTSSLQAISAK
uniref:Endonuclease n=1 Tax=Sphaeramia orbicularis TaxID=375764 RepID=A0A672YDP1_9TELE